MLIKFYKIRVVILLTSAFLLSQCTVAENSTAVDAPVFASAEQPKKKQKKTYSQPTSTYIALAKNQNGSERQKTLLLAAGRALSDGQWQQAAAILTQTGDLMPDLELEKNILLAQIDIIRNRPQTALQKLHAIKDQEAVPEYQRAKYYELLAQAAQATDQFLVSISARINLEPLLHEDVLIKRNQRKLWLTLTHASTAELNTLAEGADKQSELQGWVQLALIARTYRDNGKSLLAALDQWQTHFNRHPGNQILPTPLDSVADKMAAAPKKIALLLPLSGALQGPGAAVRDGFMDAYKKSNPDASMSIKTYDTSKGDILTVYQSALAEGAEYIVGPLTKPQVATIAAIPHPVPTLLLNDASVETQENSYQFGLSPVHEAVAVAMKAQSQGYARALIIAPGNDWGNEVRNAFASQWQKKGGDVVDTLLYAEHDDLNKKINHFLHIDMSQQREKKLKELLGYSLQTTVSRRQDFDMIFLLAYPTKARQIMPLLNYYYAADVPVFATASVYSGSANALKDKDLDGIIFCDIPWVFSHQAGARNWPEQFNSYNRLYALGKDSYSLATQLNHLMLFPADESVHGDGILYLKSSRQVARVLEWGQFKQGLAHSLGETA